MTCLPMICNVDEICRDPVVRIRDGEEKLLIELLNELPPRPLDRFRARSGQAKFWYLNLASFPLETNEVVFA